MSERSAVVDTERPLDSLGVEQGPTPLSIDRILDVLASNYRRRVVEQLSGGDSIALDSLVITIVGTRTTDRSVDETSDHESTRIALYHSHLPKLADSEVIEFDRETETIAPGPQLPAATAALNAVENVHAY